MKTLKTYILLIIAGILLVNTASSQTTPPPPEMCMVTVDENNHNVVVWKKIEDDNTVIGYYIYRFSPINGTWQRIDTVSQAEPSIWIDTITNTIVGSNIYAVSSINKDSASSIRSEEHKTMHLAVEKGKNNRWHLKWNSYEGIDFSVIKIYRSHSFTGSWEFIKTVSGSATAYTDSFISKADTVFYYIEIPFSDNCATKMSLNSIRSNIASNKDNIGIDNYELGIDNYTVYPNPTNGIITVKTQLIASPQNAIQIYDITGRMVSQFSILNSPFTIDISNLQQGIYFLKIDNKTIKIVKEQ